MNGLQKFSIRWCLNLQTDPWFLLYHRFGALCLQSFTGSMWQSKPRSGFCCTPWIPTNSELASFWSSSTKGGMTRLLSLLITCLPSRSTPFGWTSKGKEVGLASKASLPSPCESAEGACFFLEAPRNFLVCKGSDPVAPVSETRQDRGAWLE